MREKKIYEQEIALFGESGSGKTVLISAFYGAAQEPQFLKENRFHLVADDLGQGNRLYKNYLGMRDDTVLPAATVLKAHDYSFSLKMKRPTSGQRSKTHTDLRLVWHDYPGSWFEWSVDSAAEEERRIEAFRNLIGSDVALVLVDSQKLIDNKGQEDKYLKSLLTNFRNGLLSIKDEILDSGKPLTMFPRIWVLALSKADLLPEMDAYKFRDLMVREAGDEIVDLKSALAEFVNEPAALSVGEDFTLLSSAKFGEDKIELDQNIGRDLILPIASVLPLQRQLQWSKNKSISAKFAETLLRDAIKFSKLIPGPAGKIGMLVDLISKNSSDTAEELLEMTGQKLAEVNGKFAQEQEFMAETITSFMIDLDEAEENNVLLRKK